MFCDSFTKGLKKRTQATAAFWSSWRRCWWRRRAGLGAGKSW